MATAPSGAGSRKDTLVSTTGLEAYPSRGTAFDLRWLYQSAQTAGGLGFGIQSDAYETGYLVHMRHGGWNTAPDTVSIRKQVGGETEVLSRVGFDVGAHVGEYLRWAVDWESETISVGVYGESGEELVGLSAEDTTYDEGGFALTTGTGNGKRTYFDEVRLR